MLHFPRAMGVLCALLLGIFSVNLTYAEEPAIDPTRFQPSARGGRVETPAAPAPSAEKSAAVPTALLPTPPPAPLPAPAPPPEPPVGSRIVSLAATYLGTPYVFGGTSPATGFDCSGFVQWVLGQFGVDTGRVVWEQYQRGEVIAADDLAPGDLVFFVNTYVYGLSHVGIYVGDGNFIDAGSERTGVRRANMWDAYWGPRFAGARRLS